MKTSHFSSYSKSEIASWILAFITLALVLYLNLLPALLTGLLIHELVRLWAPYIEKKLNTHSRKARLLVVIVLISFSFSIIVGSVALVFQFISQESLSSLVFLLADVIDKINHFLPEWIRTYLPQNVNEMKEATAQTLRTNAASIGSYSKGLGITLIQCVIGLVIGSLVTLHRFSSPMRPLAAALAKRLKNLADTFKNIVFAQVRISFINTIFTGTYLAIILPLFGINLPFVKTMIAVTFIVGLLPVVGNLISNTVIFLISLTYSPMVAISSLTFLIVIHKIEYFLNAVIIGSRVSAAAWELLCSMLILEAIFGVPGVVAAPIYYAYLKRELAHYRLI